MQNDERLYFPLFGQKKCDLHYKGEDFFIRLDNVFGMSLGSRFSLSPAQQGCPLFHAFVPQRRFPEFRLPEGRFPEIPVILGLAEGGGAQG